METQGGGGGGVVDSIKVANFCDSVTNIKQLQIRFLAKYATE
jgi:hypothetical protein